MIASFFKQNTVLAPPIVIITYLMTIILGLIPLNYTMPMAGAQVTITDAERTTAHLPHPNNEVSVEWQAVSLPDDWRQYNQPKQQDAWYRTTFTTPEHKPNQQLAIFVPPVTMNAAIYLNGVLLGDGGQFSGPVSRNWTTPLLLRIPSTLMREKTNTLHIRVKSDFYNTGYLGNVYIGDSDALAAHFQTIYFLRSDLLLLSMLLLIILGTCTGVLWFVSKPQKELGLFSLGAFLWCFHDLKLLIKNPPLNTDIWDALGFLSLGYFAIICIFFAHHYLNMRHPGVERAVLIWAALSTVIMLFSPSQEWMHLYANYIWYSSALLMGAYALALLFKRALETNLYELHLLCSSAILIILFASHDMWMILGYGDWGEGYYTQYSAVLLLTYSFIILLRRLIHTTQAVTSMNQQLEQKVEEATLALTENYQKVHKLEHQRILLEERERITREMHDGMGGNLVSILAMVEEGNSPRHQLIIALKEALIDLRLVIDSLDAHEEDLLTVLAMYRNRYESRLQSADIHFVWKVADIPEQQGLGPQKALHIMRILQEATTNIIKHANAKSITITTETSTLNGQPAATIVVHDDGAGFQHPAQKGKGLYNMKRRAELLQGTLHVYPSSSGTRVVLTCPV